jgi:hypothetical protein
MGCLVQFGDVYDGPGNSWRNINNWFDRACAAWDDVAAHPEEWPIKGGQYGFKIKEMQLGGRYHDDVLLSVARRDGVEPDPLVKQRDAKRRSDIEILTKQFEALYGTR